MVALERRQDPARPAASGADTIPIAARRRSASPRQVLAACALGALVLAFFASRDLPSWADGLHDGPLTPLVREIAIGWNDNIAPLGLTRPHRELHRTLSRLRALQWP
ncbi:MAG TPA: hypothetical protein VJ770_04165 [Stellaceae bacterium]|nr:hypothetical protein [Stellaceae bacterium]